MAVSKPQPSKPGPDWQDLSTAEASAILKRGVFMDIVGLEGSGKSSLAATLARLGPIGYVDIDQAFDRARKPEDKKARAGIKVLPVRYAVGVGEEAVKAECGPAWLNMDKRIRSAAHDWAAGIVVDTATEDWELIRLGSFGTLTPRANRMDRLYGPVNAKFRSHLRNVYRTERRHLITIHQLKDEYKDKIIKGEKTSIRTGKHVRAGFKEIGYLADVVIRCFKDDDEFKAEIMLCKLPPNGPALEGTVLEDDDLDFAAIVMMATDTKLDDWRPGKR